MQINQQLGGMQKKIPSIQYIIFYQKREKGKRRGREGKREKGREGEEVEKDRNRKEKETGEDQSFGQ
jgi:hypothetical protein